MAKHDNVGRPRDLGFTIVELLIVIAIIGLLVAVLLPAVQSAREAARRVSCKSNLRQIGLAIHVYEVDKLHLPPGGVVYGPCCKSPSYTTWTIELLPYLESNDLYAKYRRDEFNESQANRLVRETSVPVYACPSESNMGELSKPETGPGQTLTWMPGSYRAMTGRGDGYKQIWWGMYFGGRMSLPWSYRGPIHTVGNRGPTGIRNKRLEEVRDKDFKDGRSKTIMVGERSLEGFRRTLWAYAYGAYNKSAAYKQKRMFMRNYDECAKERGADNQYKAACKRGWSSFHHGVINFVYCDASVRPLSPDIDLQIFVASATIAGGRTDYE